ncbi:TetR family transcriptional regulator [Pectobacterium versatile]|uniref:TetR/AcrR family transcriptional regulator n=1 Tax=Pectobacterium versatile TaxID=2488639 RepID=UPI001B399C76|nr:TetR/AcrR family transcriptional regulator [Pectobacterium versatile]MBQ4768541.1 TetR family transcriptional regulator [Pectobacterium versatile]
MQNSFTPKNASTERPAKGRPRAFDREKALEKATLLFWRKGFSATSMSDLTAAMGIGSPSLYAAFGSKEALYAETLRYYAEHCGPRVWAGFDSARTARDAVQAYLMDSAAALTGANGPDDPPGCMLVLSAVGEEGHSALGNIVRDARAQALLKLEARFSQAVSEGELDTALNVNGLARYILAVQGGMVLQSRDGASRTELENIVQCALQGWDAQVR